MDPSAFRRLHDRWRRSRRERPEPLDLDRCIRTRLERRPPSLDLISHVTRPAGVLREAMRSAADSGNEVAQPRSRPASPHQPWAVVKADDGRQLGEGQQQPVAADARERVERESNRPSARYPVDISPNVGRSISTSTNASDRAPASSPVRRRRRGYKVKLVVRAQRIRTDAVPMNEPAVHPVDLLAVIDDVRNRATCELNLREPFDASPGDRAGVGAIDQPIDLGQKVGIPRRIGSTQLADVVAVPDIAAVKYVGLGVLDRVVDVLARAFSYFRCGTTGDKGRHKSSDPQLVVDGGPLHLGRRRRDTGAKIIRPSRSSWPTSPSSRNSSARTAAAWHRSSGRRRRERQGQPWHRGIDRVLAIREVRVLTAPAA